MRSVLDQARETDAALRDGHYASKQIFCKDRLIAWSHRRRFETGLQLARAFTGRRILDYGCGDGTFLALLQASDTRPGEAMGAELDDLQVNDCRARFGGRAGLSFVTIDSLDDESYRGRFDAIVCMEVLEHVVALDAVIDRLRRLLTDRGTLLVSVPVEIGLPLMLKQAARRVAGWRGIGDYPGTSPYTVSEYWRSLFAGDAQHIERPVYRGPQPFHDHKGFNWRAMRTRLSQRFVVVRTSTSPVSWLGPHLGTQVWFEMRKRDGGGA